MTTDPTDDRVEPDRTDEAQAIIDRLERLAGSGTPVQNSAAPGPTGGEPIPEPGPSSGRSAVKDFGVDLTAQARATPPVFFGRDEEIETILEALCRRRKANPLLLGPPGSGKTALVEAVAARIAAGTVPTILKDQRIIAISTGALVAGGGIIGEMEARLEALLKEARGTDVILFFDEVHTLMGAGGKEGTGDVASLIKPALARGEIRCIAATTDEEYHKFIQNDAALDRRFLPIRLRALTARETVRVLAMLRDADAANAPLVPDAILDLIVDLMDRVLPNRHFPDKAIDLFDQVMASARLREVTEVTATMVESVAERMAGIPASPASRLARLADVLQADGGCHADDIDAITERLSLTLRGLDLRTDRPNLVADVEATSLEQVRGFAATLAGSLYGDGQRVLEIDGAALSSETGLTTLIGVGAGYVGYGDRHVLAALADQPCHVVVLHAMDMAHGSVHEILSQGIDGGWVTDARRRRIGFSEAVVLRWRASEPGRRTIGFTGDAGSAPRPAGGEPSNWRIDVTIRLGVRDSIDSILETLTRRWAEGEGVRLSWSAPCRAWIAERARASTDIASFIDREVATPLWRLLRGPGAPTGSDLTIDVQSGRLIAVSSHPSDPA